MGAVPILVATIFVGTPKAWLPSEKNLDERLLHTGSPFYELFNTEYQQDPVAFGLEFATSRRFESITFGFASLGGRVYEPSPTASYLEVRQDGRWTAVRAERRRDYTRIGEFAPAQTRGTAFWSYRFSEISGNAIRLRVDAPAHSDPGYRCVALASMSLESPQGPWSEMVGEPVSDKADWLLPGANLLSPATGARTDRKGGRTTVRWPRPMMLSSIAGKDLANVEYLAGSEWRPFRTLPVSTEAIRATGRIESIRLDSDGVRYIEQLKTGRSDLLGQRFRSSERPDLAEMESYLLPIDFSMGAIGRPADLHETMTLWSGMFLMMDGGEGRWPRDGSPAPSQALDRWFLPMTNGRDWGTDWLTTRTRVVDGGYPAIVTSHDDGPIHAEQTLFVTSPDDPYYANVAIVRVTNHSKKREQVSFGYATGLRPIWQPTWTPFLQDPWTTGYRLDDDRKTVRNPKDEIVLRSDLPLDWGGTERENHVRTKLTLEPGETETLKFVFPSVDAPTKDLPPYDADAGYERFRAWWDRRLSAATIQIPEGNLNDVVRNLVAQSLIIALDGDEVRYGAYFYEMYFGVEEGWPAVALAQFGQPEEAKRIAQTMLSDEHMDKANYHHQYRNGLAPWYAITVARLLGDKEWLRSIWPRIEKAAAWTIEQTSGNQDKEYHGILPRHVYGGDIGNPAYSFYSNATCWRGLHDTAVAARWLGVDGTRYEQSAARYRNRLLELADKLVDRSSGLPFLPMAFEVGSGDSYRKAEPPYPFLAAHVPSSDLWNYLGNYWNLFAPLLHEVRLFPQGDPRSRWIPDVMERRGGILNGVVRFDLGYDSVYGKGYVESLLEQGRREEFHTSMYGLIGNALSRNLFVMPEVSKVFDLRTDNATMYREYQRMRWNYFYRFVGPWMEGWQSQEGDPLAAGAGMVLQILRMALVREDYADDPPKRLLLLDGVPDMWFEPGRKIAFHRLNTFFGPVSLTCDSRKEGRKVEVEAPAGIPFSVRLPNGTVESIGTGRMVTLADLK